MVQTALFSFAWGIEKLTFRSEYLKPSPEQLQVLNKDSTFRIE